MSARWTICLETPPGFEITPDDLERFADALVADERALGPATSANVRVGSFSATFGVRAENALEATATGVDAFVRALFATPSTTAGADASLEARAHQPETAVGKISVEPEHYAQPVSAASGR